MGILDKVLRAGEGKKVRAIGGLVPDINALEPELEALSDDALRAKTVEFRTRVDNGETVDDLLIEAFAVTRDAARRVIGQRHFDVQLMGGAALHFGWVAEMKTGEGKTLVSTLPAYLNALGGKGVHIVTVNDYLASFQSEWMGRIHRFLGLDVGLVIPGERDTDYKRAQYACDITYGTNNELGFDYLRDNMAMSLERRVQRGHNFVIVDEVDSILIDEARTPLIISGRLADAEQIYYKFAAIIRGLQRDVDYEVDEEKRNVSPLESGIEKVEDALGVENLYDEVSTNLVHQLGAALKAKELYKRDKDYIIQNGEVKIVDEFTGRVLDGRRWSEGLHQAVEAKEGVKIKEENQTLATITLQNYFRLYDKISGMTGTAETEAAELMGTYGLNVVPIPTNKPMVRLDQGDLIYKTEEAKFDALVEDILERYDTGQPVLAGTASVATSERLSSLLDRRGITHEVLNAKQHFREAEIVAQAGRMHAITVATNMAGRGVDIILGGNAELLALRDTKAEGLDPESEEGAARLAELVAKYEPETEREGDKVRELGGLYVCGTERHESRRIDNQLRGRAGRQGDPGESRFYLSLEDDLMRLFATGAMNWVMGKALPDDVPIEAKMVTKAIERAQNTVEQRNAEIRKNVLKYDEVMNEQRKVIYRRREQILQGADLRKEAFEALAEAVDGTISTFCVSDFTDEWDLDGLVVEVATYWPTQLTATDLAEVTATDDLYDVLMAEASSYYEEREVTLGEEVMRQVERTVMLRIIDQKWREHLQEMDYLQGGINLRAMGQKDPLMEWQREGFDMFGQMMTAIAQDFVKYVMHVEVAVKAPTPDEEPKVSDVQYSAPDDQPPSLVG
ncbi:MAG: preprotein translocase subunit SecA, partial [Acidimicrobiia bacterium]|nr:preprotein translocase subunit SecA [Acidimicrobiia bacterium]